MQEYDIRSLLDHTEAGRPFAESAVPAARPEVRTGAELLTARLSSDYTRFDGNLATDGDLRGVVLPDPTGPDQVVSATRLRSGPCAPTPTSSATSSASRRWRIPRSSTGSPPHPWPLVHDTLDTWITEALHSGTIPEPGTAWPETSVSHLRELAEQEASRLQQRGLVGRRAYWGRDIRSCCAISKTSSTSTPRSERRSAAD